MRTRWTRERLRSLRDSCPRSSSSIRQTLSNLSRIHELAFLTIRPAVWLQKKIHSRALMANQLPRNGFLTRFVVLTWYNARLWLVNEDINTLSAEPILLAMSFPFRRRLFDECWVYEKCTVSQYGPTLCKRDAGVGPYGLTPRLENPFVGP